MNALDVAAVGFIVLAIGDIALLLGNRESKIDWALRLVLAAVLAISALRIHQRDFDVGLWVLLVILAGGCQAALLWRRRVELKRELHGKSVAEVERELLERKDTNG